MKRGTATYGPRGRLVRFWFRSWYVNKVRWPVRLAAWLLSALLVGALGGWRHALLGPVALEVAYLAAGVIEALSQSRRAQAKRARDPRTAPRPVPRGEWAKFRQEARRQAAMPRVPSPGGWSPPEEALPAWNWTPPPGVEPRLDRIPGWVRLWHATPLADRYAHAWMWRHGGFDVIPPDAWASIAESGG